MRRVLPWESHTDVRGFQGAVQSATGSQDGRNRRTNCFVLPLPRTPRTDRSENVTAAAIGRRLSRRLAG
jgi:hypothetical protein